MPLDIESVYYIRFRASFLALTRRVFASFLTIFLMVSLAAGFVIYLGLPLNQTNTNNTTPDFTFNITGENETYFCEILINGTGYGSNSSALNGTDTLIAANSTLAYGVYTWQVRCTNGSEANSSGERMLTVDDNQTAESLQVDSQDLLGFSINYLDPVHGEMKINEPVMWTQMVEIYIPEGKEQNVSMELDIPAGAFNLSVYLSGQEISKGPYISFVANSSSELTLFFYTSPLELETAEEQALLHNRTCSTSGYFCSDLHYKKEGAEG